MRNPVLTKEQLEIAKELLALVRGRLDELSGGDPSLRFALNRKIAKELIYDERKKPMERRRLKQIKLKAQNEKCACCNHVLPARGAVLDRLKAIDGYTKENTRLLCAECDIRIQAARKFK